MCQGFEICANLIWFPLWIPIRILKIIPAKHPNSIWRGAAGAQLWKASWPACGAHLLIKAGFRPSCLASWQACGQQSPCPWQNARCAV